MIAAFSASSPLVSVALIDRQSRQVLAHRETRTKTGASAVLLMGLEECLAEAERVLQDVELFGADVGPGSFIGARVGVTIAKTLAFSQGSQCVSATAFDLIDKDITCVIPNRKGEAFVRVPGEDLQIVAWESTDDLPAAFAGYGVPVPVEAFPSATAMRHLDLEPIAPEHLLPGYIVPPSISVPKVPYSEVRR